MCRWITMLFCFFLFGQLFSQSEVVQTFTYDSETRDTLIQFPEGDHNRFEKIIMYYSMRCKDAQVSTGSDRNKGCGEWDYSCNTYIVDSTRVDSVKAVSPEYDMPGYSGDEFSYSGEPTFSFIQSVHRNLEINQVSNELVFPFVNSKVQLDDSSVWTQGNGVNSFYVLDQDWWSSNAVTELNGISFPVNSDVSISNLKIRMAPYTAANGLNISELVNDLVWTEVYNGHAELTAGNNTLYFYNSFSSVTGEDVVVQFSYDSATESWIDAGDNLNSDNFYTAVNSNASYLRFGHGTSLKLEDGLDEISNEITISFWQRGSDNLPDNTTLLEGVDDADVRQVNIHLPWGDSNVYWDCGNDGSGYDRISKAASQDMYKNQWNHWAFTKNATTGEMAIYLNGELWHSGSGFHKPMDIKDFTIASSFNNSRYYYGDVDEFRVWNKSLDQQTIMDYMYTGITDSHPEYESLVLYYDFNIENLGEEVEDLSPSLNSAKVEGKAVLANWRTSELFTDGVQESFLPAHSFISADVDFDILESIALDSVPSLPQSITHYYLDGSDLIEDWTEYYYQAGDYPIYDEEGNVINTRLYPQQGIFTRGELLYYSKTPMAYEIMSFVTPYGIGLDFGEQGLTWTFDVTDYGPILKGKKRLFMSRGGQWQEEMDIRFEFIEGIPERDVIDIQQIWKVDQVPYANILNDWRYEPRQFQYEPEVNSYIIQTAITGHGGEGEFIPRNHMIDVDGFTDTWTVWKECSENPVYPQGGTWIYDRAGWCPGMATDIRRYNVTPYFQFSQTPLVDYTVQTASGDSRYIVNAQLIKYGPPNFSVDLALSDILYPSSKIEYGRFNPSCIEPRVLIKNKGSESVNNITIYYGFKGKSEHSFEWTGFLSSGQEWQITLPYIPSLAAAETGDEFYARVEIEDGVDQNEQNNEYSIPVVMPDYYEDAIIIEYKTNSAPQETSYTVKDGSGTVVHSRSGSLLSRNTIYRDTLTGLNGCYEIHITDSDDDGLYWWHQSPDGSGYVRVKAPGEQSKIIANEFGGFVRYNFSAGMVSSTHELQYVSDVNLYPNPTTGEFHLENFKVWDDKIQMVVSDALGNKIHKKVLDKFALEGRALNIDKMNNSGSYFIELSDSKRTAVLKVIKI